MRVLTATVTNFASYKNATFDFSGQGLTLISGPTGSGKSTMCDVVPWVLFGVTAKNGAVDEVRSWSTKAPTIGTCLLEVNAKTISVTRIRGSSKDNDLYFVLDDTTVRGKDLNDTQKLLELTIGVTAEAYIDGAYYHELSRTANFFTASAKSRRQLMEQVADVSFATALTEGASAKKSQLNKDESKTTAELSTTKMAFSMTSRQLLEAERDSDAWEAKRERDIAALKQKKANFEQEIKTAVEQVMAKHLKRRIEIEYDIADLKASIQEPAAYADKQAQIDQALASLREQSSKCDKCGASINMNARHVLERQLYQLDTEVKENDRRIVTLKSFEMRLVRHNSTLEAEVAAAKEQNNFYEDELAVKKAEHNPFINKINELEVNADELGGKLEALEAHNLQILNDLADLEVLTELTEQFRNYCLRNTVGLIKHNTNHLLSAYFDAELRTEFEIEGADKLKIVLHKDGNECSFTQLSKGQRQLLRLCFSLSTMQAIANHQQAKLPFLFLDEALDGLDENLKAKAFRLLETLALSYESVFVIDHSSDLKALFSHRYNVSLIDGVSTIETN